MSASEFLVALKDVSTSGYALCGYIVLLTAWVVRSWVSIHPRAKATSILKSYKTDKERTVALTALLGTAPPNGLPETDLLQWVSIKSKERARFFVLLAYVATLVTILGLVGLALKRANDQPVKAVDVHVDRHS